MNLRALCMYMFVALSLSCGSSVEAGFLVDVDTDAVVPGDALGRSPLFDRLRVELLGVDGRATCQGCERRFDVDDQAFRDHRISFGITSQGAALVRLTLYRSSPTGNVPERMQVTKVIRLPGLNAGQLGHVHVDLSVNTVGHPVPSEPEEAALDPEGFRNPSRVGSWERAARTTCSPRSTARGDAVAIDGGAFWFGDPTLTPNAMVLAVLEPFVMDAEEVTAREFSNAGGKHGVNLVGLSLECSDPTTKPKYPANCMTFASAQAYCAGRGGTLPSQAQYEFAATTRGIRKYPWGNDPPRCKNAVIARIGNMEPPVPGSCTAMDPVAFPDGIEVGGTSRTASGLDDHVDLPGGQIWDLAGNVSEWTTGNFNNAGSTCFVANESPILVQPECRIPNLVEWVARGGSYATAAPPTESRALSPADGFDADPSVGFRCVYSCR